MESPSNEVVVVKPLFRTPSFWVLVLFETLIWGLVLADFLRDGDLGECMLITFFMVGLMLVFTISQGHSATAGPEGLTVEHLWDAPRHEAFAWTDIQALEVEIVSAAVGRGIDHKVRVRVLDGEGTRKVHCPYDLDLLRAIVDRAQLELEESESDWLREGADDDPLAGGEGSAKLWVWSRD